MSNTEPIDAHFCKPAPPQWRRQDQVPACEHKLRHPGPSCGLKQTPTEPDPGVELDTEGGDRVRSNLLRSPGLGLRVWVDNQWFDGTEFPTTVQPAANGTRYLLQLDERNTLEWNISSSRDGFEMTLSAQRPAKVEVVFPFNLRVTPTTVLPAVWHADGHVETPLVISAPDFGQMLLRAAPGGAIKGRLEGFGGRSTWQI